MDRLRARHTIVALLLAVIYVPPVFTSENASGQEVRKDKYAEDIKPIIGKPLDLSRFIPFTKGVKLTLDGKEIDLSRFILENSNATTVERMLRGRNVTELMYVAAKLAAIERDIAGHETIDSVSLEDLFDSDEDTVLHIEDVDEMAEEVRDNPGLLQPSDSSHRFKRKATSRPDSLWPNIIHYKISSDFDNDYRTAIRGGIRNLEEETCLVFRDISDDTRFAGSHIVFEDDDGCYSRIGRRSGSGSQIISIGKKSECGTPGVVAHEIGHALGLEHEHSRPDRDDHVQILTDNIKTGGKHNFIKETWNDFFTSGIPYDYSSIMHYWIGAFANDTTKNTIKLLEDGMNNVAGSRVRMSFYDSKLANSMYCGDRCPEGLTWSACDNDGYRDPKNCTICRCPDGWTGSRCTEVQQPVNAICGPNVLTATNSWQTINSPSFDFSTEFKDTHCTWRIKTNNTNNKRVVIRSEGMFRIKEAETDECYKSCKDFLEVRNKVMSRSGQRFCCNVGLTKEIVSQGSEMLVLLRTRSWPNRNNFTLSYKQEECGCTSNNSEMSAPACLETQYYDCNATYTDCSTRICLTKIRHNTCHREIMECCSGFRLYDDRCYRPSATWSEWTSWSDCSTSCNSEFKSRNRTCLATSCSEYRLETQVCNEGSCNPPELNILVCKWNPPRIYNIAIHDLDFQSLLISRIQKPVAIDYDPQTQMIYWTDVGLNEIRATHILGTTDTILMNLTENAFPHGLAIDTIHHRLFYTDAGNGVIVSMNLNGTDVTTDEGHDKPRAIVLHEENRIIYWTDRGSNASISKANYDGRNRKTLVESGLIWPNGLTLDKTRNILYWCDGIINKIESFNIDTSQRTVLRYEPSSFYFGIFLHHDILYYTDWYRNAVLHITTGGSDEGSWPSSSFDQLTGLHVFSKDNHTSIWGSWGGWGSCSKTCGGSGTQARRRSCLRSPCSGSSYLRKTCTTGSCPRTWGSWGEWGSCSRTCGAYGIQTRRRSCLGYFCIGSPYLRKKCTTGSCPGTWGSWSEWGSCSRTCGGSGTQTRRRSCLQSPCSGGSYLRKTCRTGSCPGTWSSWGEWGSCSKTCGYGTQTRRRSCLQSPCSGSSSSGKTCTTGVCSSGSGKPMVLRVQTILFAAIIIIRLFHCNHDA